jgi:hypothetical protein
LRQKFFDPFATGITEVSLGYGGDDLVTFTAPGVSRSGVKQADDSGEKQGC